MLVGVDARFACARYDGVGRYVAALLTELVRRDDGLDYAAVMPSGGEEVRYSLPSASSRLRPLRARHADAPESPWSMWEIPRMGRGLAAWHAPFPVTPPWIPAPLVVTHHDCIAERMPDALRRKVRIALRITTWASLRRARVVITPSQLTADDTQRFHGIPPSRLRVIPHGVHLPGDPDRKAEETLRARLGVDEGYVLIVGRGRLHKGYPMLVRALARLDARRRPRLVHVGRPDARMPDDHVAVAARLGVELVTLTDVDQHELLSLYRGAALLALPSAIEGFGLPLLEALAAGAPVLASDIEPFRTTGGDGGAVRYVERTEAAWAEALAEALEDSGWQAGARLAGPPRARQFPWSETARLTAEAYREAAA